MVMVCHICVECGTEVDNLYVEFSLGNINLTRCANCKLVADKYIEYELILVVIDIILHRIQAYRHILFNRKFFNENEPIDIRLMFVGNILLNFFFKLVILHDSYLPSYSNLHISLHLLVSTLAEHIVFITCIFMSVLALRKTLAADYNIFRQLYISISFPELGKLPVLLLLTWDHGLGLLFLFGVLTSSIQLLSLQSVSTASTGKLLTTLVLAISLRTACRLSFFSLQDISTLGIFM